MIFIPHDYQKFMIRKMIEQKRIAAFLDLGLGKTVITLTALNELLYDRFECRRVLVIAPLRVAESTWSDEALKWDHLKRLRTSVVVGSAEQREMALQQKADIYVINRENVKWLVDRCVLRKRWPFDVIVIDESSSFKNPKSVRFKALKKAAAVADRVIELTGTPSSNSLLDLWAQIYLLDEGKRLGKSITSYRGRYFVPGRHNGDIVYEYLPWPGAERKIYAKIRDIAVSLSAADNLKMPERVDNVIKLTLPKDVRKQYNEMERECVLQLQNGDSIAAGSKAAVTNKLLQMANGAVYYDEKRALADGTIETKRKVQYVHDVKLDALAEIIEDYQGKPLLVFYSYQHDFERLSARFADLHPSTIESKRDIDRWNRGEIKLLFAHPASMGHGLNMQAGGNLIVWFGLPWSLELYLQANARLFRQGQREAVVITHLVVEGTVDADVMRSLQKKKISQDQLIEAVKARVKRRERNNANTRSDKKVLPQRGMAQSPDAGHSPPSRTMPGMRKGGTRGSPQDLTYGKERR